MESLIPQIITVPTVVNVHIGKPFILINVLDSGYELQTRCAETGLRETFILKTFGELVEYLIKYSTNKE